MSSADLKARRAGTDGIHGVRLLLGIERSKGSGEIRFMVGGGRPKADHVGFLGKNDTMAGTHHHSKRAEFKVEFERGGDTVRDPARSAFLEIP